MSSVTTSQQTGRSGADEIPAPRGGHGVRLLVLGADPDAQDLRDQAQAAGYELAQRYSARVSHVAYGPGVDPEDARYAKIRDSGLALLPLQKCAQELGLRADAAGTVEAGAGAGAGAATEAEAVIAAEPEHEHGVGTEHEHEAEADPGLGLGNEPLAFPPLRAASDVELLQPEASDRAEAHDLSDASEASELIYDREVENAFIPGFTETEDPADLDVPLAAAVLGADPWEGAEAIPVPQASQQMPQSLASEASQMPAPAPVPTATSASTATPASTTPTPISASTATPTATPTPTSAPGAGRLALSLLWALTPLATFGLLTPVTFGYAAYRLRSRGLALTALVYTLAVVVSFVLSAVRPHAASPADTSGALLTICLAGTWVGGTLHALSLRTRVFAR